MPGSHIFKTLITFSHAKIRLSPYVPKGLPRRLFSFSSPKLNDDFIKSFPTFTQHKILSTPLHRMPEFNEIFARYYEVSLEKVHLIYMYLKEAHIRHFIKQFPIFTQQKILNTPLNKMPSYMELFEQYPELTSEDVLKIYHYLQSDHKIAGVPFKFIQSRMPIPEPLPSPLTQEMIMGINAWTYNASYLCESALRQPFTQMEDQLYRGVIDFAQRASIDPAYRITQENIYRTVRIEWNPWLEQIIQNPPSAENIQTGALIPYQKPILNNPIITFAPVTSWTTYNLTVPEDIIKLGIGYAATGTCDVVFVARNANSKQWGSVIGQISCIPQEREIITPPGTHAQVIEGKYYFRPDLSIDRDTGKKPNQYSRSYRILHIPKKVIHIIYIDFVDPAK